MEEQSNSGYRYGFIVVLALLLAGVSTFAFFEIGDFMRWG